MPDPHAELLERATIALERIDRTFERQADAFDRQAYSLERLGRRIERSENLFIRAISEIDASLQRNTERLDDMADAIRANTKAVLSALDRLGPAPG